MSQLSSVSRDILIHASVDHVWEALTVEAELKKWYAIDCQVDFRIGGRITMQHGWGAYTDGVFTEIKPKERFVIRHGASETFTVTTLTKETEGIRVKITYQMSFIGDEGYAMSENMGYGTYLFMTNLKSVCETGKDLRASFWKTTLGMTTTTLRPDHYEKIGVRQGVLVVNIKPTSPAERAGLMVQDIIILANQKPVCSYADLQSASEQTGVNHPLTLKVIRKRQEREIICYPDPYPVSYYEETEN